MTLSELLLRPFRAEHPYVDQDAFAALYHQTYRHVFRYAYALCAGSITDVEDVVADTYLRAWDHRRSFVGSPDAALGWLITIARRLVFDRRRRTKHQLLPLDHTLASATPDLAATIVADEQTANVIALLRLLPENDRDLLILRYILNWPVRRIAEHLKKPPNTVSVALRRALARAREHLPTL